LRFGRMSIRAITGHASGEIAARKIARVVGPGLNWKTPLIEAVVRRMNMKVQQFDVEVETKTQDDVFVSDTRLHPMKKLPGVP
jgi:hypothetical protein